MQQAVFACLCDRASSTRVTYATLVTTPCNSMLHALLTLAFDGPFSAHLIATITRRRTSLPPLMGVYNDRKHLQLRIREARPREIGASDPLQANPCSHDISKASKLMTRSNFHRLVRRTNNIPAHIYALTQGIWIGSRVAAGVVPNRLSSRNHRRAAPSLPFPSWLPYAYPLKPAR